MPTNRVVNSSLSIHSKSAKLFMESRFNNLIFMIFNTVAYKLIKLCTSALRRVKAIDFNFLLSSMSNTINNLLFNNSIFDSKEQILLDISLNQFTNNRCTETHFYLLLDATLIILVNSNALSLQDVCRSFVVLI